MFELCISIAGGGLFEELPMGVRFSPQIFGLLIVDSCHDLLKKLY